MLLTIFSTILLPLLLLAGAAYLLGRLTRTDPAPLARAVFYVFNPCLVFVSLSTTTVAPELLGRLALLKLLTYAVMTPLTHLLAQRLGLPAPLRSAFMLGVLFANSGNLGLPLNEYAFGKDALALAVICFIPDNLMVNSLGVYLAARGRASARYALGQVFGNPALYAVPLGLLANQLGWAPPLPIARFLELASRAAVPVMLTVLGMQLASLPLNRQEWRLAGLASSLRLIAMPLLGAGLAALLGLTGTGRQVAILQSAVPSAVMANIVANRYNAEPTLVAGTVLFSTLACLGTLPVVLSLIS